MLEQAVLERRQLDFGAVERYGLRGEIELEWPTAHAILRGAARAPQQGFDARAQLFRLKRLGQIVVGAGLETLDFVLPAPARGQDQNGQPAALRPKPPDDVQAGHAR